MKCPFDKKCEECLFYTKMFQTNKEGKIIEVYKCAITWLPILLSEISAKLNKPKEEK